MVLIRGQGAYLEEGGLIGLALTAERGFLESGGATEAAATCLATRLREEIEEEERICRNFFRGRALVVSGSSTSRRTRFAGPGRLEHQHNVHECMLLDTYRGELTQDRISRTLCYPPAAVMNTMAQDWKLFLHL